MQNNPASERELHKVYDVVKYSMGICSAYIAARLKETCHDPICLFSDTKREDKDTYRFGIEVAERWQLNFCEISDGRDLWDVWRQQHIIPARQIAQCSRTMKIIPGEKLLKNWPTGTPVRVAIGYDCDEQDRIDEFLRYFNYPDYITPWFPLMDWGVTKQECFGFFLQSGVVPPRIYRHFQHANCIPCKNFREKDWFALAYHYPEYFAESLAFEAESQQWEKPGRFMQDGPLLSELVIPSKTPSRKGRRKLAMHEPAFSFHSDCGACAVD